MELNSGRNVNVLGNVNIDNTTYMICKLPNPTYVNDALVMFVLLPKHEFKEYVEQARKESNLIMVK